jgi:hypothetical protein
MSTGCVSRNTLMSPLRIMSLRAVRVFWMHTRKPVSSSGVVVYACCAASANASLSQCVLHARLNFSLAGSLGLGRRTCRQSRISWSGLGAALDPRRDYTGGLWRWVDNGPRKPCSCSQTNSRYRRCNECTDAECSVVRKYGARRVSTAPGVAT